MLTINLNNFKYKKNFKGRIQNIKYAKINLFLQYGNFGIRAKENGRITFKQVECVRKFIVQKFSRSTKIWFCLLFNFLITKKPKEVRMGKGKGNFYIVVARVYKGRMLIEFYLNNIIINANGEAVFKKLFLLQNLFPIKTGIALKSL